MCHISVSQFDDNNSTANILWCNQHNLRRVVYPTDYNVDQESSRHLENLIIQYLPCSILKWQENRQRKETKMIQLTGFALDTYIYIHLLYNINSLMIGTLSADASCSGSIYHANWNDLVEWTLVQMLVNPA